MSKFLITIHDNGLNWSITNTRVESDDFVVNHELYYETNESFYKEIIELLKNYSIKVEKDKLGKSSSHITKYDLILDNLDQTVLLKAKVRSKIIHALNTRFTFIEIFKFYEFITINNLLIDKGFVITEKNREEKYLDIINTGDDSLISLLEQYLNIKDELSNILYWYDEYKNFCKKIEELSSPNEINEASQEILTKLT